MKYDFKRQNKCSSFYIYIYASTPINIKSSKGYVLPCTKEAFIVQKYFIGEMNKKKERKKGKKREKENEGLAERGFFRE